MVTLLSSVNDDAAPIGCPTLFLTKSGTAQSIPNNADTIVQWSAATRNTGPSSWWSSGANTAIVMPWAGCYLVNLDLQWVGIANTNVTGTRAVHLQRGTAAPTAANFEMGDSRSPAGTSSTNAEPGRQITATGVIYVPTAGNTFSVVAFQSSGAAQNLAEIWSGYGQDASASFTYLG